VKVISQPITSLTRLPKPTKISSSLVYHQSVKKQESLPQCFVLLDNRMQPSGLILQSTHHTVYRSSLYIVGTAPVCLGLLSNFIDIRTYFYDFSENVLHTHVKHFYTIQDNPDLTLLLDHWEWLKDVS